jgi:pyruvate dehydrogenase complex dehydrogenase (E1) component
VIKLRLGLATGTRLFARDHRRRALRGAFANTVDGQFQTFAAKDGRLQPRALLRAEHRTCAALAQGMTDERDRPAASAAAMIS